jgi:hypothetical protein
MAGVPTMRLRDVPEAFVGDDVEHALLGGVVHHAGNRVAGRGHFLQLAATHEVSLRCH